MAMSNHQLRKGNCIWIGIQFCAIWHFFYFSYSFKRKKQISQNYKDFTKKYKKQKQNTTIGNKSKIQLLVKIMAMSNHQLRKENCIWIWIGFSWAVCQNHQY